jgi:hypothetical protein
MSVITYILDQPYKAAVLGLLGTIAGLLAYLIWLISP